MCVYVDCKVNVVRSDCRELSDWDSCKDDYMWNPSMWDCGCNKAYKIDEYLDIKHWSCEKRLFGKLELIC